MLDRMTSAAERNGTKPSYSGLELVQRRRAENIEFVTRTIAELERAGFDFTVPEKYHSPTGEKPQGLVFEEEGNVANILTPTGEFRTITEGSGTQWVIPGRPSVCGGDPWNEQRVARESWQVFPRIDVAKAGALNSLKIDC